MPASSRASLYEDVIRVTRVYLGPAAQRFIDRQIENHLHKAPSELTVSDLLHLVDWIRISISLLTEDSEIVEEYVNELRRLVKQGTERSEAGPSD